MICRKYTVRVSLKARHLRLRLSASEGLVVIVPKGFDVSRIPALLEKKSRWIQHVEARHKKERELLGAEPSQELPERILLRMIDEEWAVEYHSTEAKRVSVIEQPEKRLLVVGNVKNGEASRQSLRRWVSCKTHEHIAPWLLRLAKEKRFSVNRILVKSQRTRWASCSAKKTISLNLRLMFLPEEVVRYVLLHELAHTRQMNHSRRFWAEVRAVEPGFERLHAELRAAWRVVPGWLNVTDDK